MNSSNKVCDGELMNDDAGTSLCSLKELGNKWKWNQWGGGQREFRECSLTSKMVNEFHHGMKSLRFYI